MANWDPQMIEGSSTLTASPSSGSGMGGGGGGGGAGQPHHGLIGLVLIAVLGLFLLDKAGFRFAVAVGKK